MAYGVQEMLSHQVIVKLKPNGKVLSDCNENRGLKVECSKTGKLTHFINYLSTTKR